MYEGGWGGLRKNPFHGQGMKIFWNYTLFTSGNIHTPEFKRQGTSIFSDNMTTQ